MSMKKTNGLINIIEPSVEVLTPIPDLPGLKLLEKAGRLCYKTEDRITNDSAAPFVDMICNHKKHESVIEHGSVTVRFICDRGVTHEIVRHRIGASYSQESTRYCNYSKGKFDGKLTFIRPNFDPDAPDEMLKMWHNSMNHAAWFYLEMIKAGAKAQEARSVLPNSLKTEIMVTMNFRAWKHFFTLRCHKAAHPQMRQVAIPLLRYFQEHLPEIFGGIEAHEVPAMAKVTVSDA